MIIPDVNVLVALASVHHAHHQVARGWWRENDEPVGLPDVVVSGALRILTHPRILQPANSIGQALDFFAALRERPDVLTWVPATNTMERFEEICREANATGSLISDAYIAACAAAYGATVVTFDRDFRRFKGVRVLELPV